MKAIAGGDHVDLNHGRRTDSALAARFRAFADLECAPAGSGLSVDSPTYALLARHVATRAPLLALARECRPGQPIPNLLFAAVRRLVADEPDTPLGQFYGRAPRHRPSQELPQAFEKLCTVHAEQIVDLVRSRNVQTNEVGRCSHLMPAFGVIAQATGQDLALIDIGAGAGLNLLWNRFDYRYSDGSTFGSGVHQCASNARAGARCRAFRPASQRHPFPLASISTPSTSGTTSSIDGSKR